MTDQKTRKKIHAKSHLHIIILIWTALAGVCATAAAAIEHTELVTTATHSYQVELGGTLDEFNTAEYLEAPLGSSNVGHKRLAWKFQPNEYLIIENISDVNVVNPRIVINERRDWYSADSILASVLNPGMTDAEKAMAIWTFTSSIDLHCHENDRRVDSSSLTSNMELTNPVKWANCYYCSGCQFAAAVTVVLAQQAGFAVADTNTVGMGSAHRIAEIFHDDEWHIYDGDERMFHLEPNNITLASYDDIGNNPPLRDRTHGGGFASTGLRNRGFQYKYNPKNVTSIDSTSRLSTMAMTLRPGEKFRYNWSHIDKYRCGDNSRNIKSWRPEGLLPYQLANGEMSYEPNLSTSLFPAGSSENVNIHSVPDGGGAWQLEPIAAATPAYVIYEINTPYPAVGGRVGGKFYRQTASDTCRIWVYDPNSTNWVNVWQQTNTGVLEQVEIEIDNTLDPKPTPAIYQYFVKFEFQADSVPADVFMKELYIETDVQMSGTALPSLSVGTNNVEYSDESGPSAVVRLTHGWNESSATNVPSPPPAPAGPEDAGRIAIPMLDKLHWQPATDTDGTIADYHVQLSTRADMLWPVSPNFDRITFSSEPNWPLPCAESWLLPDHTYYWRVRAKDNWGAWSDWSDVWSFTATDKLDGDLNESWVVDFNDLRLFCKEWLDECLVVDCNGANFDNSNNIVDFGDYVLLAQHWFEPYPLPNPNLDLVGWYKFDSASGTTAYDSSASANHGTLTGGAAFAPASGKSAGAVRLEGGSERVEIATTSITANQGTISAWIRAEGNQAVQRDKFIFGCNDGTGNRIQLYIGDDYYTRVSLGLGAYYEIRQEIITLNTDRWYHVALTWQKTDSPNPGNGDYAVYVDCCKIVEGPYISINPLPTVAHIGNSGDTSPAAGFIGLIDEVRLYDRALNDDQIMRLYNLLP